MTSPSIGTRIKEARENAGLRFEDLASRTGLSFNTVRAYESGRHEPTLKSLRLIADATGVDPSWFMDGEEAA